MTNYLSAQHRTLVALHDTLFAQKFRALENYGAAPTPIPSSKDVIEAAHNTIRWHRDKAIEVAYQLDQLRDKGAHDALITEAQQTLSHHQREISRIEAELEAVGEIVTQAAE